MSQSGDMTDDLRLKISENLPGLIVWRNNRVDAIAKNRSGKTRRIRAGINGQADLSGICPPHGRRVEIEIKAGKDYMKDDQKSFRHMIVSAGGWYLICRDVDVTLDELAVLYRGEGN